MVRRIGARTKRRKVTKEQRDLAVLAYKEGETVKFINDVIGVGSFTLYKELHERGIPKRHPEWPGGRPRKYDDFFK